LISKGNVVLGEPTAPFGGMAACRHANGRDWWLVKLGAFEDEYFVGILNPQGVSLQKITYPGMQRRVLGRSFTYFNQNGDKMLRYAATHRELHEYDFDRCSGELSNLVVYDLRDSIEVGDWNACTISPDGTKFYVRRSGNGGTLQYDLETSEYTYITHVSTAPQLTPNYKHVLLADRYFTENDSMVQTICTIYEPNKPGLACNYVANTDTVINIYNLVSPSCFANFRLGKLAGSPCDTVVDGVNELKAGRLKVYPNPSRGQFSIEFENPGIYQIHIYNVMGQRVFTARSSEKILNVNLNTFNISPGLVLIEAYSEESKKVYKSKLVYEK